MIVRRIALNGFRNYDFETADFDAGTNVICGDNAQGKTNLLEAVYMLAMGRSFRTRFDKELVSFGSEGADILADVYSHGREQTVNLRLTPGKPKRILVNAVKKTAGELSDTVNAVLFCPDDLNLIKEGAAVRRRLMDNAISQIRPRYAEILSDFNKLFPNGEIAEREKHFLHPMSHELDFMNIYKAFQNPEVIEYYASKEFQPDYLTLFFYEIKQGKLVFQHVDSVKFHVFQIKDWYFEVSWFNRSGMNSGWLMSNVIYMPEKEKTNLIKFYQP